MTVRARADRVPIAVVAARAVIPARHRPRVAGAVRSLRRRGNAVHCPCCGGCFDRFIAHNERSAAKCPRCGSLERHRLLLLFLRARTDVLSASVAVLHVAPEPALQRSLSAQTQLDYLGVDLDSPFATDHADLQSLPYHDGRFDIVICSHVLEHVADDHRAMVELRRVLRPGGRAIILSPIDEHLAHTIEDPNVVDPEDRRRVFGQSDHVRRYGRDFAGRLRAAGFDTDTVRYIDELAPSVVVRMGLRRVSELFERDDIFVCVKAV